MKLKLNILTKMLVFFLGTTALIFAISSAYISYRIRVLSLNDAENYSMAVAKRYATEIEKELNKSQYVVRTLSQTFALFSELDEPDWKYLFEKMGDNVFKQNPNIFGLTASLNVNAFDSTWNNNYGRYLMAWQRPHGIPTFSSFNKNLDGKGDSEFYTLAAEYKKDMLWTPRLANIIDGAYDFAGTGEGEKKIVTNISTPIIKNNEFKGWVVADFLGEKLDFIMADISPFDFTEVYLLAHNGVILWNVNKDLIGTYFSTSEAYMDNELNITKLIADNQEKSIRFTDDYNSKTIVTNMPVNIIEEQDNWALVFKIPYNSVLKKANRTFVISILVSLLGLIVLAFIIYAIARNISGNILLTTQVLKKISMGDIDNLKDLETIGSVEIEDMANSVNVLKSGLKQTSKFAQQIGEGKLKASFTPLSDKDILGNSLLDMRNSLQEAKGKETIRKGEDEKRNWVTHGLAEFGGILRANTDNIEMLSYNILKNLINYLDVNQGAVFVVDENDDDAYGDEQELILEMKSAIAYDREKHLKERIAVGESLVGRCAYEKKTVYMTDLPQDYINITSGLGTANPKALLLVPLILNDEIYGVVELASFHPFEDYQIEFIEKIGESIAGTIATARINERTSMLLDKSKSQGEELAAQEEEMRQNLEELQATQDEALRREFELKNMMKIVGKAVYIVEYDLEGSVLSCNETIKSSLKLSQDDVLGLQFDEFHSFEHGESYAKLFNSLQSTGNVKIESEISIKGNSIWIEGNYYPILDHDNQKILKVVEVGYDISVLKNIV